MGRLARGFVLAGLAVALAACGVLPRNPVPPELTAAATIPGMPDVRAWAGRPSEPGDGARLRAVLRAGIA
jgi:hypothetical protein